MFEYEVWSNFGGEEKYRETILAETPGKAKYQYFLDLKECFDIEFKDFVKHVRSKKVGIASVEALFTDAREFKRMCQSRGLADFAFQGMTVEVAGKRGKLVGNYGMNLYVVFDGQWIRSNCHPWWETKYFDNEGNVIRDYTEQAESV